MGKGQHMLLLLGVFSASLRVAHLDQACCSFSNPSGGGSNQPDGLAHPVHMPIRKQRPFGLIEFCQVPAWDILQRATYRTAEGKHPQANWGMQDAFKY